MPRTRSARAAAAVAAATATSANAHPSTSDVKISTSSILKGATLDDSFFEAPNSTSPTSSTSFTFDLRVSEFPGTPGDVNGNQEANPFFHRFEEDTTSTTNHNSANSPSDGQRLSPSLLLPAFETDWDATLRQRHRTVNRVSFSSSVASSAPSTAASETGEDSTDADWDSNNFTAMRHQVDGGLSEAFEQQHLAGPCSFSDHQYDPSNDAHQNQPSHGPMSNNISAGQHQRGISIPSFNLEDFISDAEQQHVNDVPVSYEEQHNTQSNDLSSSWHTENSSVSDSGHFGAAANAEMLAALEGSMLPHQRRETSDSTGSAFSGSSSVASPPSPTTPGSTNADAYQREVVSQHSSPFFSPARCATTSNVARSMSFNGQPSPSFAHQQAQAQHHQQQQQQQHLQSPQQLFLGTQRVVAASPVQHPSLLRVGGGMPQTPVRSQSTSNLPSMYDNNLSCNPAYITPGDAAVAVAGLATPLEGHHQGYFQAAHRSDFPDSPASSAYSSPLRWTSALPSDDGAGEDTYRDSGYGCNGAASSAGVLSSSLPTRSALLSVGSAMPAPNVVPVSPSLAGQPMRPGRSSMQSSPYAVPVEAPHHQHHLLPPSHPLSHLHNPYSGVITKRSRGRRVPITPEEMTNVGKSGKVYTCKVPGCGKLFKRSEHLKRHIRSIHTDEKPFTCQICHKRFSRHDNLNQHMRVHGPAAVAALAAATAAQQESGGALGDYASSASSFGDESSPAGSPLSTSLSVRRHSFLSQGSYPHFDPYEAQLQHQQMQHHHQQGGGNGTIKGRRQTNASAPTLDSEVFDFDDGMSAGGVEDGDVQLFSL